MATQSSGSELTLERRPWDALAKRVYARLGALVTSRELVWALVAVGVVLRARQYLLNRSLWLDESFLSVDLIDRSFRELFEPLQFNQASPAGFLVIEKLMIEVFGKSEYALRAFPLVCGLASLPLFVRLAQRVLAPAVVPLVLGLFALSGALVYYSSEVKPYAVDVLATLVLYLIGLSLASDPRNRRLTILAGVVGAVLIQICYVAIFVAAAIGVTLLGERVWRRAWRDVRILMLAGAPWALSAALFLWLYGRNLTHYTFEGDVFAKVPTSPGNISWWKSPIEGLAGLVGVYHTIHEPAAPITIVAGLLCILGALDLFARRRLTFFIIGTPVIPMLAASALQKYPLLPRTLLFLVPLVLVLLGRGLVAAVRPLGAARGRLAVVVLTLALVGYPAVSAAKNLFSPNPRENMKWALRYVSQHWRPGDVLYLHYPTQYAFTYYGECGCFRTPRDPSGAPLWPVGRAPRARPWIQMPRTLIPENRNLIVGVFAGHYHRGIYRADVARIARHRRAWILITFVVNPKERRFIRRDLLGRLDRRGMRVLSLNRPSTRLYLYEFRRPERSDASARSATSLQAAR